MSIGPRPLGDAGLVVDGARRYARADAVLWRRAWGTVVVLPLDGAEVIELSGTAVAMWDLLAEPVTIEEAAASLAVAYDAAATEVAADIEVALAELVRMRLVVTPGDA